MKKIFILVLAVSYIGFLACACGNQSNIVKDASCSTLEDSDASVGQVSTSSLAENSEVSEIPVFSITDLKDYLVTYYQKKDILPSLHETVIDLKKNNLDSSVVEECLKYSQSIEDNIFFEEIFNAVRKTNSVDKNDIAKELNISPKLLKSTKIMDNCGIMILANEKVDEKYMQYSKYGLLNQIKDMPSLYANSIDALGNDTKPQDYSQKSQDIINGYLNTCKNILVGFYGIDYSYFNKEQFIYQAKDVVNDLEVDNILKRQEVFYLEGEAALDNYYEGETKQLKNTHFCVHVIPNYGNEMDKWYVYLDKNLFSEVHKKLEKSDKAKAKFACTRFSKNSIKGVAADII